MAVKSLRARDAHHHVGATKPFAYIAFPDQLSVHKMAVLLLTIIHNASAYAVPFTHALELRKPLKLVRPVLRSIPGEAVVVPASDNFVPLPIRLLMLLCAIVLVAAAFQPFSLASACSCQPPPALSECMVRDGEAV